MHKLRFRQVHLDFHTSPQILNIGGRFDKQQYKSALKTGHVNVINCFAKCHHGWSYHPTRVGKMHPHLSFDLLREQFEANRELGILTQIYLSAGLDNLASHEHPEWRELGADGRYLGWSSAPVDAGFHTMCFNTPYLDYLCEQIREVMQLFQDGNGIWLDIIHQNECCCRWCLAVMDQQGWDATQAADRRKCSDFAMQKYFQQTTETVHTLNPEMPIFHNSGHITRGNREILKYFSHLEVESLPTGGWGYDHFPISAKYCNTLPLDYVGMTGKFHTTWGEFGGYKHPNALLYECAAMLAYGSKCSIGDQLHPEGEMDLSTYKLIGKAYAEVEAKEAWCKDAENVADIGLLSSISLNPANIGRRDNDAADVGAGRMLLEAHLLFDVLDREADFSKYKLLILPDNVNISPALKSKLDDYLAGGGKLMLTGESGLAADGSGFLFDIGAEWHGASGFQPDFILPKSELRPGWINSPHVMYMRSQRIKVTDGQSLGDVYDPYFNRTYQHFCSHQHAPAQSQTSGFDCGVQKGNILYLAHPIFALYRGMGATAYRDFTVKALLRFWGKSTVESNLPSTARLTLMQQPHEQRYILHLLYANTLNRGGRIPLDGTGSGEGVQIEVIEELLPLRNIQVGIKLDRPIQRVTLEPQGSALQFETKNGMIHFEVDEFTCHQMVVLNYA